MRPIVHTIEPHLPYSQEPAALTALRRKPSQDIRSREPSLLWKSRSLTSHRIACAKVGIHHEFLARIESNRSAEVRRATGKTNAHGSVGESLYGK